MMPSPYTYQDSDSRPLHLQVPADQRPQHGFYRPSATGKGDVFLFSPSLCSRNSKESTSQSSASFDAFSYTYSPANDLHSGPKACSPPLARPQYSRSPLFVEAYLSGLEPKSISRGSPGTPFQQLFNSSPAGYWQDDQNSVSPISRNSSAPIPTSNISPQGPQSDNSDSDSGETKIESLLEYEKSHSVPDSPVHRPSTPSSLSSLSSIPSSPSALFSNVPRPSSQTSRARTPCFSSPGQSDQRPPSSLLSPLGSPFKLSPSPPSFRSPRPSTRTYGSTVPSSVPNRSLAADILNQLGRSRPRSRLAPSSSFLKPQSSPAAVLDTDSDDENYQPPAPNGRKRTRASKLKSAHRLSSPAPANRRKRQRTSASATASASFYVPRKQAASVAEAHHDHPDDTEDPQPTYPNRTFPLRVPIHDNFPLFYRRFPVSSVIHPELAAANAITVPKLSDATLNDPRDAFDMYTPRFVKGKGTSKVGLCPICHEPADRGGEGKKLWLSMKFSAFKCYHMQYYHGISAPTGRPFSPPTAFRTVVRPNPAKHEKTHIMEGRCHKCRKWVPVEGVKDVEAKVPEIFWWKHAAGCHQGGVLEGEGDVFVEDEVWAAVSRANADAGAEDVPEEGESQED